MLKTRDMITYKYRFPGDYFRILPATVMALVMVMFGCAFNQGCHAEKQDSPAVILECKGNKVKVGVEIADTPFKRKQGLMFRKNLDFDNGMLFIFPGEKVRTFWMKNTLISLDMIFINGNNKIVGIIHNAEPLSTERLSVPEPAAYVLEVRAGFSKKYGIYPGCTVEIDTDAK
ncbi:MAG: DUF192 domain-containing protein [Deltaproteobacteria bacterium]|nr:DUF192 domain-containing protein [Deltaproteobacteria bacterium]